jgi:hypothetical protein
VSLGDLLDRGADSRKVMDLLMRLQGEAHAAGGQLHVLLGNHEAMNLLGDLRYVDAGEFAAYKDMESAAEREEVAGVAGGQCSDPALHSIRNFRQGISGTVPLSPGAVRPLAADAASGDRSTTHSSCMPDPRRSCRA